MPNLSSVVQTSSRVDRLSDHQEVDQGERVDLKSPEEKSALAQDLFATYQSNAFAPDSDQVFQFISKSLNNNAFANDLGVSTFDKDRDGLLLGEEVSAFRNEMNQMFSDVIALESFDEFKDVQSDINEYDANGGSFIRSGMDFDLGRNTVDTLGLDYADQQKFLSAKLGDENFGTGLGLAVAIEAPNMVKDMTLLVIDIANLLSANIDDLIRYIGLRVGNNWSDSHEIDMKIRELGERHPLLGLFNLLGEQGGELLEQLMSVAGKPDTWTAQGLVQSVVAVLGVALGGGAALSRLGAAKNLKQAKALRTTDRAAAREAIAAGKQHRNRAQSLESADRVVSFFDNLPLSAIGNLKGLTIAAAILPDGSALNNLKVLEVNPDGTLFIEGISPEQGNKIQITVPKEALSGDPKLQRSLNEQIKKAEASAANKARLSVTVDLERFQSLSRKLEKQKARGTNAADLEAEVEALKIELQETLNMDPNDVLKARSRETGSGLEGGREYHTRIDESTGHRKKESITGMRKKELIYLPEGIDYLREKFGGEVSMTFGDVTGMGVGNSFLKKEWETAAAGNLTVDGYFNLMTDVSERLFKKQGIPFEIVRVGGDEIMFLTKPGKEGQQQLDAFFKEYNAQKQYELIGSLGGDGYLKAKHETNLKSQMKLITKEPWFDAAFKKGQIQGEGQSPEAAQITIEKLLMAELRNQIGGEIPGPSSVDELLKRLAAKNLSALPESAHLEPLDFYRAPARSINLEGNTDLARASFMRSLSEADSDVAWLKGHPGQSIPPERAVNESALRETTVQYLDQAEGVEQNIRDIQGKEIKLQEAREQLSDPSLPKSKQEALRKEIDDLKEFIRLAEALDPGSGALRLDSIKDKKIVDYLNQTKPPLESVRIDIPYFGVYNNHYDYATADKIMLQIQQEFSAIYGGPVIRDGGNLVCIRSQNDPVLNESAGQARINKILSEYAQNPEKKAAMQSEVLVKRIVSGNSEPFGEASFFKPQNLMVEIDTLVGDLYARLIA